MTASAWPRRWAPQGYVTTDRAEDADMVLLNTCHIREKAAEKVYSDLGRLRPLKLANPNLKIGVAGCVAQAEGDEILRRAAAGRSGGRPAKLSPPARDDAGRGAGGARHRHRVSARGQVRPPARARRLNGADRLPDGAGRLRQVLRLLRRALHARGRGQPPARAAAGRGARSGGARGARDHAAGPERQCLPCRRDGRWRGCCGSWRGSTGWTGCATPPPTRTTWKTT